jgi:hypothetical protein
MKVVNFNSNLINGYIHLLERLSPKNKMDLITQLSKFTSTKKNNTINEFTNSFGAWKSNESAEEIIEKIEETRSFNRDLEAF